jgi:hypothetical protein
MVIRFLRMRPQPRSSTVKFTAMRRTILILFTVAGAMDKVGVDGAIFISAFSMYRYDASYAVEVQRAHPGRFAIVKPVDPDDPNVADVVAGPIRPSAFGTLDLLDHPALSRIPAVLVVAVPFSFRGARRLEEYAGHGRNPHHADEGGQARAERPGPRPDPTRGRSPRLSGQHPVLGQLGRGHGQPHTTSWDRARVTARPSRTQV